MDSRRILSACLMSIAIGICFNASARAETVINVIEDGEGGMPMSIKLDQSSVKAGPATFLVRNDAVAEPHEMILVRLTSADQTIPLDKSKHRIDEKKLKSLGEVSDLKPGSNGQLKTKLTAGDYLLFCNIKGHYEAGMATHLVVTP